MELVKKLGMSSERLVVCVMCLSLAANVILTFQLNRVRSGLRPAPVAMGERVPAIELIAKDGTRSTFQVDKAGLPTLVYWFRPSCSWCALNLPNAEALARQAGEKYRFLAVSDASPAELATYSKSHQLGFPVYTMLPPSVARYHFQATPASLLVSAGGVTVKHWAGAYAPTAQMDLERTLSIKMPGMSAHVQKGVANNSNF